MLRLQGHRDLAAPPAELRGRLSDPHFLVECAPDVEAVKTCAADHAALTIRPSLAFVRGTLDVVLRILPTTDPDPIRVTLASKGIGSSSELEGTLTLAADGDGTKVHWTMDVKTLGGLLKLVPQGLIRGAAEKVINDGWDRVSERLQRERA